MASWLGDQAEKVRKHLSEKFLKDNERETHPDLPGQKNPEHKTLSEVRKKQGPGSWQADIGE